MKILYVNHYAGSLRHGMEYRPFYLAREWVKAGHQVRIVAASYSHVRSRQPEMQSIVQTETIEGVEYVWLRTPRYPSNGIKRFINMLVFCFRLFLNVGKVSEGFQADVVIASSTYPMDIFPARYLARRLKARLIFEVHDLWPLSPIELGGMSPRHPFIRLMQFSEDYAYRVADRVVSLLPLAKEYMLSRGMRAEKFSYVPNGILFEEWDGQTAVASELAGLVRRLRADGHFVVAYAGAHGLANSLGDLIEAARLLPTEKISIVLIGDGLEKRRLQELAAGLKNVYFHDSIPKDQIPATLREFDALYIGLKDNSLFRFGISPNKLLDYMAAGRPILKAINSGNDPVLEASAGLTVAPENPRAIADGLRQLAGLPVSERERMGSNGRRWVRENHDFSILADRFLRDCR